LSGTVLCKGPMTRPEESDRAWVVSRNLRLLSHEKTCYWTNVSRT